LGGAGGAFASSTPANGQGGPPKMSFNTPAATPIAGGALGFGAAAGAGALGATPAFGAGGGAFSLGAKPGAPAAGGFNLGGAKPAAPAAGGFNVGGALGAKAAAPAAAGFNVGGALGATATEPSMSKMTYGELNGHVTKWQKDLKSKRKEFKELGEKVTMYDSATGENWNQIKKLDSEVNAIKLTQEKLTNTLEGVEKRQSDIRVSLQAFDIGEHDFHDTGNSEGEKIFESANGINNNLDTTCSELQRLIHEINATSSATHEKDDAIQQITQLLQEHVTALQDVERATETLEQRIQESKDHMGEGLYQSGYGF